MATEQALSERWDAIDSGIHKMSCGRVIVVDTLCNDIRFIDKGDIGKRWPFCTLLLPETPPNRVHWLNLRTCFSALWRGGGWKVTMHYMSTRQNRPKVIVQARVDADAVDALDAIAASLRPQATRSQMVDAAILEYVERHAKKKGKDRLERP